MPPVPVMGHLLPSRMPDKRSHHLQSNSGTNFGIRSMLVARTLITGRCNRSSDSCKQLSVTRSSWW